MNIKRMMAVMRARFREFYRDTASWTWNLMMPLLIIFGFYFIFSGDSRELFKVALYNSEATSQQELSFLQTEHIRFIEVDDLAVAIVRVQRHQFDMLLDRSSTPPRYWVNPHSANGYMLEKLYHESFSATRIELQRELVSGQDIRYVDWLVPGVLAMNMMFSCLWGVGWVVVRYRKNGVLKRLQATPLTPFEFLTAQVIARIIIIIGVTLTVFVGANLVVGFTVRGSYLALFLVFLSGAACLTSMGLIVATRLKTEEVADGMLNLISWPMMFFSGVWFSMEGTHPLAQLMSQLFPLTHLVDAARRIMIDGAGVSGVAFEISLLSGLTVLLLLVSARLFRWT
ncbi:MAG: ABC transporter permease [Gammaproteobacteria bacterium]|nr:ABC transporter permease [Gammaproteobacteria bacterium]MBL7000232.1 ABC transporter permease [Gammaproteobacteria bacterium]